MENLEHIIKKETTPYTESYFKKGYNLALETKDEDMTRFLLYCVNNYSYIPYEMRWRKFNGQGYTYISTEELLQEFKNNQISL